MRVSAVDICHSFPTALYLKYFPMFGGNKNLGEERLSLAYTEDKHPRH